MLEAELRILKGESGRPDKLPKRAKPPTKIKCPGLELIGTRREHAVELLHYLCKIRSRRAYLRHNEYRSR